jgi:hypothetical protein
MEAVMSSANDNADTELFKAAMALVRKNFSDGKTAAETKEEFERLYRAKMPAHPNSDLQGDDPAEHKPKSPA